MASLRDSFQTFLDRWPDDLAAGWRGVIGNAVPDVGVVGPALTLEPNETIFPGRKDRGPAGARADAHVFRALDQIEPSRVRAVVLGQDPYPKSSRATGRAFEQGDLPEWSPTKSAVAESLRRIVQALAHARTGEPRYIDGDAAWGALVGDIRNGQLQIPPPRQLFDQWQERGIVFLNAGLTLSRFQPEVQKAHIALWRPVVKAILTHLATRTDGHIVFILWGQVAQRTFDDLGVLAAANAAGTQHRVTRAVHVHPGAEGAGGRPLFFNPPNPLREAAERLSAIGGGKLDW